MHYCDLTFPTPEENLACDEALLDWAEEGGLAIHHGHSSAATNARNPSGIATAPLSDGLLRLWEAARYFVVLGYANCLATEVNAAFCRQNTIPILRRCTGGGTVMQGPGLFNYTLVLPVESTSPLHNVTATNKFIMERHRSALSHLLSAPVEIAGHTDLAIGGLKFSGNAQRRRKHFLLFHGSFLLHFDIDLMQKALPMPSTEPDYRLGRPHSEFLMNLKIHRDLVKRALTELWKAAIPLKTIPYERLDALVREKYSRDEWNAKF